MKKSKNNEKVCKTCGRIITDPSNRTGLCPRCERNAGGIIAGACAFLVGGVKLFKKFAKK